MTTGLRALIAAIFIIALSACGGGGGSSESLLRATAAKDKAAPEIIAITPADNAVEVADSAGISLRFNEPIREHTVRLKLVHLDEDQSLEGFVHYQERSQTVVFIPHRPLPSDAQFQVQLLAAEDLAGNSVEPINFHFSTEKYSFGRPYIIIQPQAPEGGVFEGGSVTLRVVLSNLDNTTSFAWFRDTSLQQGERLEGQSTNAMTLTLTDAKHSGYYYCRISNSNGQVQTIPVYVEVKKPLELTQSPASVTRLKGSNVTFRGDFTGTEAQQLQWYKGTQALIESAKFVGVKQKTLQIKNITTADAGQYHLRAVTANRSMQTNSATLTVIEPVVITQTLQDKTVAEQSQLRLAVTASGSSPLKYTWFHNNIRLEGETQPSLLISSVSQSDQGVYRVLVSNEHSRQDSSARITILGRVNITRQPYDTSVFEGADTSLSVVASGSAINYQWQKQTNQGWLDISSAASSILQLKAVSTADAGNYRVKVSNSINTVYSDSVNVYVGSGASITKQPQSHVVVAGANVSFNVAASGDELKYEWRKNGQLISGETGSVLTINNATVSDQAVYQCRVWNASNSVNCAQATLTIAAPLSIVKQPQSTSVFAGEWVNMKFTVQGYKPSYRWYKNGSLMAGETGQNLSLGNVTAASAGRYQAEAYNQFGQIRSIAITVEVKQPVRITSHPQATVINPGSAIRLTVAAQGSGLSYEWFHNGVKLNGQTGASLLINSANATHGGSYSCRVWNSNNSVNCNAAVVTVREAVGIYSHTQSFTIHEGSSTRLSVVARGYQPKYRWFKSGVLIPGETSSQLNLTAVSKQDNATYRCEVYNDFSEASCGNISLTVLLKPVIQTQSLSQRVNLGDSLVLAVTAKGSGSLRYQWHRNGQILAGETYNELRLTNIQSLDLGSYHCQVSNSVASVNSGQIVVSGSQTHRVRVSWVKPTQREDGSPLSDSEIASYRVYMQVSNGGFSLVDVAKGANTTSLLVSDLYPGSYTFKVRTVDSLGQESGDSVARSISL